MRPIMQDTDLAWLGGYWDGEGSIALFTHTERTGNTKICPTVSVINTDIALVNKSRKILEELGCNFVLHERKPKNTRHSTAWVLTTRNQDYIIKFLTAVSPYLWGEKRQKAEILLDYCQRRSAKIRRLPSAGSTPYDESDWKFVDEFKKANIRVSNNHRSSTTTREALEE